MLGYIVNYQYFIVPTVKIVEIFQTFGSTVLVKMRDLQSFGKENITLEFIDEENRLGFINPY